MNEVMTLTVYHRILEQVVVDLESKIKQSKTSIFIKSAFVIVIKLYVFLIPDQTIINYRDPLEECFVMST